MVAYELAIKLPGVTSNHYSLHQLLWRALAPHQHIDLGTSFLFRLVEMAGVNVALARFSEAARQLLGQDKPFRSVACPVAQLEQCLQFTVRLCPLIRSDGMWERTPPDPQVWCRDLLLRNGLGVVEMHVGACELGFYAKTGLTPIQHNTRLFTLTATVLDINLAQRAWLHGVGRRKSAGCGLLLEQ